MALVDRCKLCGSQRIRPRYELERYALTVVECDVCRLTFVGDDLSDEQIDGLYAESGLADYFVALEKRHEHKFEPRLRELPRVGVPPGARVLDVGCGTGEFPALAKAAGYDAVGLDVSQPSISAARELHPDVEYRLAGADELAAAEPASYDRVADAAYSTIPPVGKLMLMQRYSQWHLQIWTTATLSRLVRDHGLDIAWTRKHRELTATPSLYLRQQRFTRLADLAQHLDGAIEALLPIRNKLTLYARRPATGSAAGSAAPV